MAPALISSDIKKGIVTEYLMLSDEQMIRRFRDQSHFISLKSIFRKFAAYIYMSDWNL